MIPSRKGSEVFRLGLKEPLLPLFREVSISPVCCMDDDETRLPVPSGLHGARYISR